MCSVLTLRKCSHFPTGKAKLGEALELLENQSEGGVHVQLRAVPQVEVLEVGELPEAFGQQTGEMEHNGIMYQQVSSGATYCLVVMPVPSSCSCQASPGCAVARSLRAADGGTISPIF